jgi:putative ABC transport system permease protein
MMVIGFVVMSFSIAITEGGYDRVISSFTREKTGHIQIYRENFLETPNLFKNIKDLDKIINDLSTNKNILGITPRIISGGLANFSDSTLGIEINGVDFERERKVTTLEKRIISGGWFSAPGKNELILGKKVADILNASLGSKVALISQAGDGSTANDNFEVVGILKENPYDDFLVYMEFKTAQEYFILPNKAHKLILMLENYHQSEKVSEELKKNFNSGLTISPWFIVEEDFFKGMTADKAGNKIFYSIVGLMVAIGILNTILMSFLERKREFGILKAIGTRPTFIFSQIMTEGIFLSIIASLIAIPLAYSINYYFSIHGIPLGLKLEFGGIVWDTIISTITWKSFVGPILILFISTFFVSLYPAILAAKVLPIESIRAN